MNVFLICLVVSAITVMIQRYTQEELVRVSATVILLLCLFTTLIFAPWLIKFLIVMLLLLSDRYISLFLVSKEL